VNEVGRARRISEAADRSAWDSYCGERGAIAAARAGDASRLVDCLRGCSKPLTGEDYDQLTAYIASRARRSRWPRWLADILRRRRSQLSDEDYERLADFVEAIGRQRGGMIDAPVHRAARLAEVLLTLWPGSRVPEAVRADLIERACEIEGREADEVIDREQVRDLLKRPKARRHKH
jgi:hypothetical protein